MKMQVSYHQERLWFMEKFAGENSPGSSLVYHNIPLVLEIDGPLEIEILEQAIKGIINRHEALRTRIVTIDDKPFQWIWSQSPFKLEINHLDSNKLLDAENGKNSEEKLDETILSTVTAYSRQPISLENQPLISGVLFPLKKKKFILLITIHHIIFDRSSLELFTRELAEYYQAYINKRPAQLPDLTLHYADFSTWQHELPDEYLEVQLLYWKRKWSGKLEPLKLPTDRERPLISTYHDKRHSFILEDKLKRAVSHFSRQQGVSDFIVLLAAFKVLLHRYCQQEEIIVGTPAANREQPGTENIIGPIDNLLVLKSNLTGTTTFSNFISDLTETVDGAFKHRDIPFGRLVLELKPDIDISRTALFDVLFQYEQNPLTTICTEKLRLKILETNLGWGNYDLNLIIKNDEDFFSAVLVYNKDYYNDSTVSAFVRHYKILIQRILEKPHLEIPAFSFLTEEEKKCILQDWNHTPAAFPRQSIHQLFQQQVEKTSHHTAVVHKNMNITYDVLDQHSNRLANHLRNKYHVHSRNNNIVGLMVDRSPEMVIGILGILKAGAAYLPIDPQYPGNRLKSLLEDCQVEVLLTSTLILNNHHHLYTDLQGLHLKKLHLHQTDLRSQIKELDEIQVPDRSLVDYERYHNHIGQAMVTNCISLQASRGCPYHCVYCHKIWPKTHVYRSAENIIEEINIYYDMGVKRFALIDDIFNFNVKNSSRFFQLITANNINIQLFFPSGMRGDLLTTDYIDLMMSAGTIGLALALETPVPRLQKLIKKNLQVDKLQQNLIYICEKYPDVILELFTMHGFPTETQQEALQTLGFIKSLKWLHFPYINILRIFPNTEMEKLALENGISRDAIYRQDRLTQDEFADTLPFDKNFTANYQADFLNDYFLLKERLLQVLPYQMKVLTENEIIQKYDSYLPTKIKHFNDILNLAGIHKNELKTNDFLNERLISVPQLNEKMNRYFPLKKPRANALKLLLLDLSQQFSFEKQLIYDVIEPPLGCIYLLTYLKRQLGSKVKGKIIKSGVDFDNYNELKAQIEKFQPDVIGVRSLTYFKDFFHKSIAIIRQWGFTGPVIAGGPYATSDYTTILQDRNIDVIVRGEGEITFYQLIEKILENNGKLPGEEILQKIQSIVFVPNKTAQKKKGRAARHVLLWDQMVEPLTRESADIPDSQHYHPTNWAYIIYTSGSTGKPKGCPISHQNVVRLIKNHCLPFTFNERDVWITAHSYCFDFSVWEIFGSLLNGAKLIIPPWDDVRDVNRFHHLIRQHKVSVLNQTPAAFYHLIKQEKTADGHHLNRHLRYVIFGGDQLNPYLLKEWAQLYSLEDTALINMYGITETTVHVTFYALKNKDIQTHLSASPIGRPLPETLVYILNENLSLAPIKVAGEIYVGGTGLTVGYLNNPALTHRRFIGNPFKKNETIYKTGDAARWLPHGEIEYLGRLDNQVKIRGYRIELAEIEIRLQKHRLIKEAVVVQKEKSRTDSSNEETDRFLCAYIVTDDQLAPSQLRKYLSRDLPGYMIPQYFVSIPKIPLTANGKVDGNALPPPQLEGKSNDYTPPRNEIEKKLAAIWSEILGVKENTIGIDSDFFDLGGHSLKATLLTARIHQTLEIKIPLLELFKTPNIRGLGEYLQTSKKERYESIKAVEKKEYYPLSSAQKRAFIIQQLNPGRTANANIPVTVVLEGTLDINGLQETFRALIQQHESFRTSFATVSDVPVQRVHENPDFKTDYHVVSGIGQEGKSGIQELEIGFGMPFDLSRAPLLRVGIIKQQEKHILLVEMHHIISDGMSHALLQQQFMQLYNGGGLPRLKLQYKDYSEWQQRKHRSGALLLQQDYWLKQFAGEIPRLNLPFDYEIPETRSNERTGVGFFFNKEQTRTLKKLAAREQSTLFVLLLTLYYIFLAKVGGQEDIVVGTMSAGRDNPDLQHIIGMFVNTLALRNRPTPGKTFNSFLKEVKQNTLEAFENQDYQFEDLVDQLVTTRDGKRNPLFDTRFTLENIEFQEIKIKDIKIMPYNYRENRQEFGNVDLELLAVEKRDILNFYLKFNLKLFKEETINRFVEYFKEIAATVMENKYIHLGDISISYNLLDSESFIYEEDQGDFQF